MLVSFAFIVMACGNNNEDELDSIDDKMQISGIDSQKISAQNVFNTISSRSTIIEVAKLSGAEYNVQFLNNPDVVNNYSLESSQALNLGVYGADLNAASIFDQTQETMLFFKCVNILAKRIGVSNSFDENMGDRMTNNQENRDSTLSIISQAFQSADITLRKNNRPGTSTLLVAGAWVEGIYIACQSAKENNSELIVKEIFLQKESLLNLVELVKSSTISDEVKYISNDLNTIKSIYDAKIEGVNSLNSLSALDKKIAELRTKIVSSK
ncbi:MAG: hypothetical protein K9H41_09035 [Bacteroidia bacterium]|nr:hypothetical protein [Bacteroidia bacterium]